MELIEDERTNIFNLWTNPKNRNLLRSFYEMSETESFATVYDEVVHSKPMYRKKYRCGRCNVRYVIGIGRKCGVLLHISINPRKYLQEGEVLICEWCAKSEHHRFLDRNPSREIRVFHCHRYHGVDSPSPECGFSRYWRLPPDTYVYDPTYDYYIEFHTYIPQVVWDHMDNILQLRIIDPMRYDPYYVNRATLFDILWREVTKNE